MTRVVFWSIRKSKLLRHGKAAKVKSLSEIPERRLFLVDDGGEVEWVCFFNDGRLWSVGGVPGFLMSEAVDAEDDPQSEPGEFSEWPATEVRNWLRGVIGRILILPLIAVRKEVAV